MFYELTLATALFLLAASFFAGFVDSIAGGGGLIQLPALLIGLPKSDTAEVLGTNKLSAVFGTTTAAALYRKQIKPDPKVLLGMGIPAFFRLCSRCGSGLKNSNEQHATNGVGALDHCCDLYLVQTRFR